MHRYEVLLEHRVRMEFSGIFGIQIGLFRRRLWKVSVKMIREYKWGNLRDLSAGL